MASWNWSARVKVVVKATASLFDMLQVSFRVFLRLFVVWLEWLEDLQNAAEEFWMDCGAVF